jgi:tRNA U54 and U55 pseudouridine synthase Pus10
VKLREYAASVTTPSKGLVEAGVLRREQITHRTPWEVGRRDLDAERIRSVIERLHRAPAS